MDSIELLREIDPAAKVAPTAEIGPYTGIGPNVNSFGSFKKMRIAGHMETGFTQFIFVADIARDIIGDTAAPIGNEAVLVQDSYFCIRHQTFDATRRLWPGCNSTDNYNFFAHCFTPLSR